MAPSLDRISVDPAVMGGRPCVKGTRVTVGTVVGLLAEGHDVARVLELYPYLAEADIRHLAEADIRQCLAYASWRSEEQEVILAGP